MSDVWYPGIIWRSATLPIQRGLTLPSGSSSSAWAAATWALTAEPDRSGYNTSVLSNSSFGTWHSGQSSVLHMVVAAISRPSDGLCSEGAKSIDPDSPFPLQSGSTCPQSKADWSMNDMVHAAMVEVQAPVPLPLDLVVGEGCWLQYGQQSELSPRARTRHDSTIIVETPHCPNIPAIRIQTYVQT